MGMSTEELKFVASHLLNCRKHGYKKYRVLIEADSKDNGKRMANILSSAYNADLADYSGGYKDFSLVLNSVTRRDEVVENINSNVRAYREAHPDVIYTPDETPTVEDDLGGNTTKSTFDWTTWLVVGAAAVVILLLLWDRKRK